MLRFPKQTFAWAVVFFTWNILNVNPLKYVSMNNQKRKIRPEIINVNSNELSFYPYSVKTVNVIEVVIISMIYMQNYVFLVLLKTYMSINSI